MLLIVLLALAFAADNTTCDKVYMSEVNGKCGGCYGGNALKEDKTDCVTPQSLMPGCVSPAATKDSCVGGCTDYYYQDGTKCTKGGIDNCVKYDSKDKCSYCKENYAVQIDKNDTSKSKCVESEGGCLEVDAEDDKKCVRCYGKIEEGKCKDNKPDIENCEVQYTNNKKDQKTICIRCKKGFYLDSDDTKCQEVKDKIDNCETYEKDEDVIVCSECKEGYYVKNSNKTSECIKKDFEHCQTQVYNEKEKRCYLCENKYAIKDDKDGNEVKTKCEETKIEYCSNIDNKEHCKKCWTGYSLTTEGKCEKCDDSNAIACSLDGETSYACKETYGYAKNYALNKDNKCEKVNSLASIKKMSASVSMTVMLFVVLFLLF